MITSKKVYIAPSVFYAFINRADTKHEQACAYFRFFSEEQYQLYTDQINIVETYNRIYKDISPSLAKDFLRVMNVSGINILYPEETDTKHAIKTLVSYQSNDLTYPKALMAVLADRRSIPQICTFEYLHSLFGLQPFFLPI